MIFHPSSLSSFPAACSSHLNDNRNLERQCINLEKLIIIVLLIVEFEEMTVTKAS